MFPGTVAAFFTDITFLQTCQDGRQVSGPLDDGAGSNPDIGLHLVGNYISQGGLAQSRKAVQEDMIDRFSAGSGGLDGDLQILLELLLTNIVFQEPGTQTSIKAVVPAIVSAHYAFFVIHASDLNASLNSSSRDNLPKSSSPAVARILSTAFLAFTGG